MQMIIKGHSTVSRLLNGWPIPLIRHLSTASMSTTYTQSSPASATSQIVTLPSLPELFDSNFLDVLVPVTQHAPAPNADAPEVTSNTMMDALRSTVHQKLTTNDGPAFSSTLVPTLDAYLGLRTGIPGEKVDHYLDNAWAEDPDLTLRIIWSTRSIHDGKGEKELFYRYVSYTSSLLYTNLVILGHLDGSLRIIHGRRLQTSITW